MTRTVRVAAACLIALTTMFARAGVASRGDSPDGGNPNLGAVLKSLLFGNAWVHEAFVHLPFTVYNLTNNGFGLDSTDPVQAQLRKRQIALYQIWKDPSSIKLLAYMWSNAHRLGDDLAFDPCLADGSGTCPVAFWMSRHSAGRARSMRRPGSSRVRR